MLGISKEEKIFITGASGMVGTTLVNILKNYGYNILDTKIDLTNDAIVNSYFFQNKPDYVIHLAAKVGGVKANTDYIADFYNENIRINTNVLHFSHKYKVKKVLSLLSTCIYPDKINYPLTEDQIHNGPPHESNYSYAYTKRMLDIQSKAYRQQYNDNFITVIPNNIFGKYDNFDLEQSHVIPAIIRKIFEAKRTKIQPEFWGDGSPIREFTYSNDIANIILFMLENYNKEEPINIGNTEQYSIKQIVDLVANIFKYDGDIKWNAKSTGQFKKPSDNSKFKLIFGKNFNYTPLKDGLIEVCEWFTNNYPNIRGF